MENGVSQREKDTRMDLDISLWMCLGKASSAVADADDE